MKPITLCLLIVLSISASAQMSAPQKLDAGKSIGKVTNFGTFVGELRYVPGNGDTLYTLMYRNYAYTEITDIQHLLFHGNAQVLDTLYATLRTVFLPENKGNKDYILHFNLGDDAVMVTPFKSMGTSAVMIQKGNGYALFTEKQLDKLFGKR